MASDSSFDVVSQIDRQEMVNAVDQVSREITTRFDLKNTGSTVTLEKDSVVLACDTEFTLKAVRDILIERSAKRGFSTKVFDFGKIEPAQKGTVRQSAKLRQGIDAELGRTIGKLMRDKFPKLKAQIQGDAVRVSGSSKDMLQAAMKLLREQDYVVPLQFNNYR
ncbi:MAG: YajQ family cyclic di-GMP-binding protein [Chloroflexi bacterium]|nr:YajQ family cyclic di-GMP-binding protein [Chloroflexota bacterium]